MRLSVTPGTRGSSSRREKESAGHHAGRAAAARRTALPGRPRHTGRAPEARGRALRSRPFRAKRPGATARSDRTVNPQSGNHESPPSTPGEPQRGHVALVGAGPGDAELLTLRGAAALARADVVVNLREPGPELAKFRQALLRHCREDVAIIDPAGCGGEIDAVSVGHAREGKRVVRLYSGDPLLACRGAELTAACRQAGIEYEIVPGLSAVTAVPAFAGVPLLPDGVSEARVIDGSDPGVDWERLAKDDASIVVMF